MGLTLIEDKSGDRKYFAMVPRLLWPDLKLLCDQKADVDALAFHVEELGIELDLYDKWLYLTIKSICGEDGTECYVTTKNLAKYSGMSVGKVSAGKAKLVKAGFITIIAKKRSPRGQAIDHITVIDVWKRNIEIIEERERIRGVKGSPGELKGSPGELKGSPGEPEEDRIEEESFEGISNSKAPSSIPFNSAETKEDTLCALMETTIEKLSRTFGDIKHLDSNITQAYNIWNKTDLDEEFITKIEEAAKRTKERANIRNRMKYFFQVLRNLLDIE